MLAVGKDHASDRDRIVSTEIVDSTAPISAMKHLRARPSNIPSARDGAILKNTVPAAVHATFPFILSMMAPSDRLFGRPGCCRRSLAVRFCKMAALLEAA